MSQVGHLSELQEKYRDRGFVIVAVSKEPTGVLESKMLEQRGVKYWMASDPAGETMKRFITPKGSVGIPHAYLVDAFGRVVSEGFPNEQQIESLLENTFDPALGRDLHRALGAAVKAYEKGDVGKAWALAGGKVEDDDETVRADATFLREKCEAYAGFLRRLVEDGIAARDYAQVFEDIETLTKGFSGMEAATWAAEKKAELEGDDGVTRERSAWKDLQKAMAKEEKAGGKEKKLKSAVSAYRKIVEKHTGTLAAERAQEALERLGH